MKSSMKKVLSFVLALAMVVLATVPAFAATGVVDPADPNHTQIKFVVTKGGLKTDDGTATTEPGKPGEIERLARGEYELTDGEYLTENTTYVVEMEIEEVVEGTPNKFAITTNAKGQISSVKAITEKMEDGEPVVVNEVALDVKAPSEFQFEFKLANPADADGYTIYTRDTQGKAVETATDLRVYAVEVENGEYVYGDSNAINQVDYDRHLGNFGVPAGRNNDNGDIAVDSKFVFSDATLELAKNYVSGEGLPIVALVEAGKDKAYDTDDDIVVFTNFSKDRQAVLTLPVLGENYADLKVIVRGLNNPTVAVEGATVEIQKNSTELFGPESFGEAIATGKTNSNGEVTFSNVKVADLLKYLSDDAIEDDVDYEDSFKEIRLPFRAVVTAANGYSVPEGVTLTASIIDAQNGEVVINLVPTGASQLVKRIYGDTRFDTSVEVAKKLYANANELGANQVNLPETDPLNGKKTVILANGMDFPDALTANGLVKYYDAPILLTDGNKLAPSVEKFIEDYDVEGVIILGGTAAVNPALESALEKQGLTTTRLFGDNRYGTSAAVAQRIASLNGGVLPMIDVEEANVDTEFQAFVASGMDFADALVASVPAAIYGAPILLTAPNAVPAETTKVINDYKVVSGIVVGGDAAITPATYTNLNIATKERIYGENRQLTSMRVAERFFPQAGSAFVAGGLRFPDALVGGALSAEKEAPILLSNSANLTPAVKDYIVKHKITDVVILGGTNAVSTNVQGQLNTAVLEASK
ncbi:cell wall-binding repeat-containing protein [Gallicola sp. Sow4_E12]|uniref:cell wall-binding repeat-containing protein n=1 Tax=Gallicola sp. Sow4_E12 TaxID=3438785 RepID=UPI003F8E7AFF